MTERAILEAVARADLMIRAALPWVAAVGVAALVGIAMIRRRA